MRAEDLESGLLKRRVYGEFIKPAYDDYCLSSVPQTILSYFGAKTRRPQLPGDLVGFRGADKVVLVVADGLGYYDAVEGAREPGLLKTAASKRSLLPLTTVFPSTTAAALTTLSTGLTPQEHCVPEWFVYLREVGSVVATIPFSVVGQQGRDGLVGKVSSKVLFSNRTIHHALRAAGVRSVTFVPSGLARSAYSKLSHAGSELVPFITSSDLMASLRKRLEATKGPTFFYVYWEKVDTIEHAYAPGSEASRSEVSLLSYLLKKELLDRLGRKAASETLLLLTADHGQIRVADKVTYLNGLKPVTGSLMRSPSGKAMPPWGSARDAYLYVDEKRLERVLAYLSKKLGRGAVVLRTEDAVQAGLFGLGKPEPKFLDRIGNLMILPRKNNLVWYKYRRGDRFRGMGHHGGMTPREMLIPFVASRLSELQ